MINDPLASPKWVLHRLGHSSALYVLMALLMDDCPRPCSVGWLCTRAGKSNPTVNGALALLRDAGIVREVRPGYYDLLSAGVKQLPLPLRLLGQADIYNGELVPNNQPLLTGELVPNNNQPFNVAEKFFSPEKNFFTHDDDDLRSRDHEKDHHHQSSISARDKKFSSSAGFLEHIGMDGPYPVVLTDTPLPVLVAWWWSARSNARIRSPHGFVRSRLTGAVQPPTPFLSLAESWLEMGVEDREYLVFVATGNDRGSIRHIPPRSGEEMLVLLSNEFYPELDAAALDAFLSIWRQCPNELSTACG